jgi:hypothetical protein
MVRVAASAGGFELGHGFVLKCCTSLKMQVWPVMACGNPLFFNFLHKKKRAVEMFNNALGIF